MGFNQDNQPDSSFKHLQLMLMRIDLMIHREVRHWQLANQNAADLLRAGNIFLMLRLMRCSNSRLGCTGAI